MAPLGLGIGFYKLAPDNFNDSHGNDYSLHLDGNSDYINLGNSGTIKITETDTSEHDGITIAFWAKKDDWNVTTAASMFSCFQDNGGWAIDWSTRVNFKIRIDGSTLTCTSTYKGFEAGTDVHYRSSGWAFFTGTFDGRYAKLYINGVLVTGDSSVVATVDAGSDDNAIVYNTDPATYNADVVIGAEPGRLTGGSGTSSIGNYWPGYIDETAIWSKALSANAVKELFDAVDDGGDPLDLTESFGNYSNDEKDSLIGWWRMENGAEDSSSNSTTGDVKGTADFDTDNKPS